MDKVYTAQEMRDKATELQESADEISRDAVEEGGCTYKPLCKADAREIETITNMLRQAAEMRERCEEKRKELDDEWFYDGAENLTLPMNECYKIIDYIIRGYE